MSSYIELKISDGYYQPNSTECDNYPVVRIELANNAGGLETVLEDLIKPALLASGFAPENVNDIYFKERND